MIFVVKEGSWAVQVGISRGWRGSSGCTGRPKRAKFSNPICSIKRSRESGCEFARSALKKSRRRNLLTRKVRKLCLFRLFVAFEILASQGDALRGYFFICLNLLFICFHQFDFRIAFPELFPRYGVSALQLDKIKSEFCILYLALPAGRQVFCILYGF